MSAKRAPAALDEDLEVPARLCCLHHTEAVTPARDLQVERVVAGDLEEHAAVRTALVGLSGRVQEAGTEADTGCDAPAVAHQPAHLRERALALSVHLQVGEQ